MKKKKIDPTSIRTGSPHPIGEVADDRWQVAERRRQAGQLVTDEGAPKVHSDERTDGDLQDGPQQPIPARPEQHVERTNQEAEDDHGRSPSEELCREASEMEFAPRLKQVQQGRS